MNTDAEGGDAVRARFVPASKLDFSRYAKDLAWLIERPLNECQEILARIYGYEHLHELQQHMEKGHEPGPYWDDGIEDKWGTGHLEGPNPYDRSPVLPATFSGQRSSRAVDTLLAWKRLKGEYPYLDNKEDLITDLGLTDSPASHRDCVRRVKLYLKDEASVDPRGWPTGFWSSLHPLGGRSLGGFSTEALRERFGVGDLHTLPLTPRDSATCQQLDLAVDVLLELSPKTEKTMFDGEFEFWDLEAWPCFWDELAAYQYDGWSWEGMCVQAVFGGESSLTVLEDDAEDHLKAFVRWPCQKTYDACGSKLPYAEAVARVSKWRNEWLTEAAASWRSEVRRLFSRTADTFDTATRIWRSDLGWMQLLASLEKSYDTESVARHRIAACLSKTVAGENCVLLGMANGWLFSPCESGHYVDGEDLVWALEEKDEIIEEGWSLVKRYMAMRGIPDMNTWVNSGEGSAMLVGRVSMTPEHGSADDLAQFCRLLARACGDDELPSGIVSSDNEYWRSELPGRRDGLFIEDPDDDAYLNQPGVIVLEIPGLQETGFLIGNEDGDGQQIFVFGSRAKVGRRAEARWRKGFRARHREAAANEEPSRARAILEKIGDCNIDIIITGSLSDPFGQPDAASSEDAE